MLNTQTSCPGVMPQSAWSSHGVPTLSQPATQSLQSSQEEVAQPLQKSPLSQPPSGLQASMHCPVSKSHSSGQSSWLVQPIGRPVVTNVDMDDAVPLAPVPLVELLLLAPPPPLSPSVKTTFAPQPAINTASAAM